MSYVHKRSTMTNIYRRFTKGHDLKAEVDVINVFYETVPSIATVSFLERLASQVQEVTVTVG